tara:strand:+ start:931 stop:1122 length:192 start_codon:yes stop_codon:yes gene_type:complete
MITHSEYDDINSDPITIPFKLPLVINKIEVSHDGGRLEVCINGERVYYSAEGTRDCCISFDNK